MNGYFVPPSSGGLHFYSVAPCRVLDTRFSGSGQPFIGILAVMAAGTCNIPSTASAVVLNSTVVPVTSLGYLTMWADGLTQPYVATMTSLDGAVTSNMAIVPVQDGALNAYATNLTHLMLDVSGFFAP